MCKLFSNYLVDMKGVNMKPDSLLKRLRKHDVSGVIDALVNVSASHYGLVSCPDFREECDCQPGWTLRRGVTRTLLPLANLEHLVLQTGFFDTPELTDSGQMLIPSFMEYHGADQYTAKILRSQLPLFNLADRQNESPSVANILRACIDNPDQINFGGYLISPPRSDERVSIDTIYFYYPVDLKSWPGVKKNYDQFQSSVYEQIAQYFQLDQLSAPDEFEALIQKGETIYSWRAWWD